MASADSSLLNPGLCANTERLFDVGRSPCLRPAKNVCSSCDLVQVRHVHVTCEESQSVFTDCSGLSTVVKTANWPIGRHTRMTADPHTSKKHGGHHGFRKAAVLHLSVSKDLRWGSLHLEAGSICGAICQLWMCLISSRMKDMKKVETTLYFSQVRRPPLILSR